MASKIVSNFKALSSPIAQFLDKSYVDAVESAYNFLRESSKHELFRLVGQKLNFIPDFEQLSKRYFVKSYQKPIRDDILSGYGIFKVTESKVLQIDWTSGHYQLPLGYHYEPLNNLLIEARQLGIVDDTHNNTPGMCVKLLAEELVKFANICTGVGDRLDRVTCVDTGTVASSTSLKSILYRFIAEYPGYKPVFIMQEGNYHGTDFLEQHLRGMWKWLFKGLTVKMVKPNDIDDLYKAFKVKSKEKVAAVVMEPVLMNNRALYLEPDYVGKAKELCSQSDAILFLDEIQTGMWSPKVFMSNEYGGVADVLSIGKGLTNGYSPLAYSICKEFLDNQDQYSSISTNGNADMAALAGLMVLRTVNLNSEHIELVGNYYFNKLLGLKEKYPEKITAITGRRHLAGISMSNSAMAGELYDKCLEQGIFVRLQTYKEGASTIITKPPIIVDVEDVDVVIDRLDFCLSSI